MSDLNAHLTMQNRHRLIKEYWHTDDITRAKEIWALLYPDEQAIQELSAR